MVINTIMVIYNGDQYYYGDIQRWSILLWWYIMVINTIMVIYNGDQYYYGYI